MLEQTNEQPNIEPYTFEDFAKEFQAMNGRISALNSKFTAIVDNVRFSLRPTEEDLLQQQRELIESLRALKPEAATFVTTLLQFKGHEEYFFYSHLIPEMRDGIEYLSRLYSNIFDVFVSNVQRGKPAAFIDAQSLTSDSIQKREQIIEHALKNKNIAAAAEVEGSDVQLYISLLQGQNLLEAFILHSYLCDSPAMRSQGNVYSIECLLKSCGVPFWHVFAEMPGEALPGFAQAQELVLECHRNNIIGPINNLKLLRECFDTDFRLRDLEPSSVCDQIDIGRGLISSAKYNGPFVLWPQHVVVGDLCMKLTRSLSGMVYEEARGVLELSDNNLYLGERKIGQTPWMPFIEAGIEAIAYTEDLKGFFVASTDAEGRLYFPGMPNYLQFPFNKNEVLALDVEGDSLTILGDDLEPIFKCSPGLLKAQGQEGQLTTLGDPVLLCSWPTIEGSDIPVAGSDEHVQQVKDALRRISDASPAMHQEIVRRLRYIDLFTEDVAGGRVAESHSGSHRLVISMKQLDGSLERIMEAFCHEVLGRMQLSDTWGSLSQHFSRSVARGGFSLGVVNGDFLKDEAEPLTITEALPQRFDSEIVAESYATAQHVNALMDLYKDTITPNQRGKYLKSLASAEEDLGRTARDLDSPNYMSAKMREFVVETTKRLAELKHRVESSRVVAV